MVIKFNLKMLKQFNFKKVVLFFVASLVFIMPCKFVLASNATSPVEIKKAIELRNKALVMQNEKNYFEAMKVLAEAISLYPQYAQAYCDMGILYEAFGIKKDAEIIYLKALEIDPGCLAACTNLALLYESMQDFSKAAPYWKKRAELGSPNDKWTQKARERFLVLSQTTTTPSIEAFSIEEKVKKEIADNSEIMKSEAKNKKEINALKDNISSIDRDLSVKKQEFELVKQKNTALKEKNRQELIAKNQEIDLLTQQINSLKEKNQQEILAKNRELDLLTRQIKSLKEESNKLSVAKQQIDQLNQQISFLQQESEKKLSAKDEQIDVLKQKILYVKQQSKDEIVGKQQEVAKAAEQLTDLIGSLREDVSSWQNKNSPRVTAMQN
ncbi:MAG: hypothetical protein ABIH18_06640 [Candidatus Omnitrophota bacterium]